MNKKSKSFVFKSVEKCFNLSQERNNLKTAQFCFSTTKLHISNVSRQQTVRRSLISMPSERKQSVISLKKDLLAHQNKMIDEQTFFLSLSFCFEYFYFHNLSLFTFIVRNSYILCAFTAVYRNDDALKRPVGDEMNHLMRHGSKLNIFNH